MSLYREEAVAHQRQRLLGTIVLRQSRLTTALGLVVAAVVCAVIAIIVTCGFARRETVQGFLLPSTGLVTITTPQAGIVAEARVKQGQAVRQGDLLFVLTDERQGAGGGRLDRVGAALREHREVLDSEVHLVPLQAAAQRATLKRRLHQVNLQMEHLREAVALQTRRADLATETYQRFAALDGGLAVSRQEVEERHAEAMSQQVLLHNHRRELASLVIEKESVASQIDAQERSAQQEVARIKGALSDVKQAEAENETRGRWEIRAPRAGVVTLRAVDLGRWVHVGDVLASLSPEGAHLEAVLYAPSRAAGQTRIGMPTSLRFSSLPYQKFGQYPGTVVEVSKSPMPLAESGGVSAAHPQAPVYRVRVALDTAAVDGRALNSLQPGTQLEATLVLEHRRFFEWAFEPLIGVAKRL